MEFVNYQPLSCLGNQENLDPQLVSDLADCFTLVCQRHSDSAGDSEALLEIVVDFEELLASQTWQIARRHCKVVPVLTLAQWIMNPTDIFSASLYNREEVETNQGVSLIFSTSRIGSFLLLESVFRVTRLGRWN